MTVPVRKIGVGYGLLPTTSSAEGSKMKLKITIPIFVFFALSGAESLFAQRGSLNVSSFPAGAQVWIDGVFTGKLTPMSTSLLQGPHTVTVQIPDSGWKPETRRLDITSGNND